MKEVSFDVYGLKAWARVSARTVFLIIFLLRPILAQEDQIVDLPLLITTATLYPTDIANVTMSASLVTGEDLEGFGAVSISDSLDYEPGMFVQNNSGRVKLPSIRGTRSTHTLVLVDGRRLSPGFKSMTDLNQLLLGGVDRVEVLRGPVSALYGSDAIGGVVNVVTVRGESPEPRAHLSFDYGIGEWDSYSASAMTESRQEAWGLAAAVSTRHTGSWESGDGAPSDVDDVTSSSGFTNVDYHFDEDSVLRSSIHFGETERIGMRPTGGGSERTAEDSRLGVDVAYEQTWNGGDDRMILRAYADFYDNEITFDLPAAKAAKFNQETESHVYSANTSWFHEVNDFVDTVFGMEYLETDYDITSATATQSSVGNVALFGQAVFKPMERVDGVLGLRYDDQDDVGGHVSPRASLAWKSEDENWRVHTSLGSGFRAPNVTELYLETYANGGKTTVLPNAELDPENSVSYELGVGYAGERWSVQGIVFRNEVKDMIEQVTLSKKGNKKTTQWQNLSMVEIDGFEGMASVVLSDAFQLQASFTWLDPIDTSTGFHVEGQYEMLARLVAVYSVEELGLYLRLGLNWEGDVWGANDVKAYDDAFTVDLRVSKALTEGVFFYVGARNLLDDAHETHRPVKYFAGMDLSF